MRRQALWIRLEGFSRNMQMLGLKGNIKLEKTCLSSYAWPQQGLKERKPCQQNKDGHEAGGGVNSHLGCLGPWLASDPLRQLIQ